jgi:hypothetical protein
VLIGASSRSGHRNRRGCLPTAYPGRYRFPPKIKMYLSLLAHPTRFERVTFAFGGQRSNYAGQSRNAPFNQSQESGAVCSRLEPIKSALATSPAIPATDGIAMATKSEAAPMASNSHPVISVLPSESILHPDPDRRRRDKQLSEDKRRGQTRSRIQDRRGSCRLHGAQSSQPASAKRRRRVRQDGRVSARFVGIACPR